MTPTQPSRTDDALRHAVLMGMDAFRICMGKPTRNFDAAEVLRWMNLIKKARKTPAFRAGMQSAGRSPAILGQERVRTMGDLAIRKSTKSRVKPAKPMLFGASTGRLRLRRLLGKADTPNCRCAGAPASKLRNPLPSGRGGVKLRRTEDVT